MTNQTTQTEPLIDCSILAAIVPGKDRLASARQAAVDKRAAGIATKVENNLLVKTQAEPKSLRKAINAMCFQCVGGTVDSLPDPGWRQMIGTCTAPDCALYKIRPYNQSEVDDN